VRIFSLNRVRWKQNNKNLEALKGKKLFEHGRMATVEMSCAILERQVTKYYITIKNFSIFFTEARINIYFCQPYAFLMSLRGVGRADN
jgi:hypothetical protein